MENVTTVASRGLIGPFLNRMEARAHHPIQPSRRLLTTLRESSFTRAPEIVVAAHDILGGCAFSWSRTR